MLTTGKTKCWSEGISAQSNALRQLSVPLTGVEFEQNVFLVVMVELDSV